MADEAQRFLFAINICHSFFIATPNRKAIEWVNSGGTVEGPETPVKYHAGSKVATDECLRLPQAVKCGADF